MDLWFEKNSRPEEIGRRTGLKGTGSPSSSPSATDEIHAVGLIFGGLADDVQRPFFDEPRTQWTDCAVGPGD